MPHRLNVNHHSSVRPVANTNHRMQQRVATGQPRVADYTLQHAGRQVRLGPVAFWIVVGTLVIMAGWTITTGTYFAFRDDVLTRLMARQTELQYGYEDRIADLRAEIDRLSSRHLLDQEQYEQKLGDLTRRQATLEQRASALSALPDTGITGSIKGTAGNTPLRRLKPSPINDNGPAVVPGMRGALLTPPAHDGTTTDLNAALARVESSLDRVDARQSATLKSAQANYDAKAQRMRGVLADLGVKADASRSGIRIAGVGGPFVPARPPAHAAPFERQIYRINIARAEVDHLRQTLANVPLGKPIAGELDVSSGFGVRIDPFGHGAAMHTGVDFRGTSGAPVRATAAGTVKSAGWSGGYGRMVEIDHGNGLATRYGHLSAIEVHVGQVVTLGEIVGRIGSTGRSTGPHLHYETRVNGEPVDPQKFLHAGMRLSAID